MIWQMAINVIEALRFVYGWCQRMLCLMFGGNSSYRWGLLLNLRAYDDQLG